MPTQFRGVNLGGWLVLERWITPSVFAGTLAQDETQLCRELGEAKQDRLNQHKEKFITEEDVVWIKQKGMNALRVPVPHWVFGDVQPYVGCLRHLDWIMDVSLRHKLQVVLDLHTAPGSQNGNDHSGLKGKVLWHVQPGAITQTLKVIARLSERYCRYPNLLGIELLNEPSSKIPKSVLMDYYRLGYDRVRRYCDDSVAVIISDTFDPMGWKGALTSNEYKNVWLDTHLYQCFSEEDKRRGIHHNIRKARQEWGGVLTEIQKSRPVIVGEWSLSLGQRTFLGMGEFERDKALQAYGRAQLEAYQKTQGWFYWTYKTEEGGSWSFRESVRRGWLQLDTISA